MGLIDNIKNDARGNRTKLQSSDAQKLESILNNAFYLEKNIDKEVAFLRQVMTRGAESQERKGLHASAMIKPDGQFCLREQVLSLIYKQLQGAQINVSLKRIFEEGNAIHEKWQRLFVRAGWSNPEELDKTQFCDRYRISFTPDIICRIPEFYDGDMIGEIKSVNTFQFQRMTKHPTASKQLAFYMYLTGIHKGFVLNEDKNTQEFRVEIYDYNPESVTLYLERAEAVKTAYKRVYSHSKMVPRPSNATAPDCKRCKECVMRDACWNMNNGKTLL